MNEAPFESAAETELDEATPERVIIPSRRSAYLHVLSGSSAGRLYAVSDQVTIGRAADNDVAVPDEGVSRMHARLQVDGHEYVLTDVGSRNGTRVRGERVQQARLREGEVFCLGTSVMLKVGSYDALEVDLLTRLYDGATRDTATGLLRRDAFLNHYRATFDRARRQQSPLTAAVVVPASAEPQALRALAERLTQQGFGGVGAWTDEALAVIVPPPVRALPIHAPERAGVALLESHASLLELLQGAERELDASRAPIPPVPPAPAPRLAIPSRAQALANAWCFGPFRAEVQGRVVSDKEWRTQKVKQLVAWLIDHRERGGAEEELMDLLWPDADPTHGRKSLNGALVDARRCLRLERGVDPILRERERIRINPDFPLWDDVNAFEEALQEAAAARRSGAPDGVRAALERAAGLYGGPFLHGCYLDWADLRRQALEQRAADTFFELAAAAMQRNEPETAMQFATRTLDVDALHTDAHVIIIRAHAALGRPDRAMKHFDRCSRTIREELGVDPPLALVEECLRARLGLGPSLV